jgi:hypothetical protein
MLPGLVRAGFAAAEREVVKGWRQDDRGRPVRIAEAGRRALLSWKGNRV